MNRPITPALMTTAPVERTELPGALTPMRGRMVAWQQA